jgi:superfamily II DNA/RNA helicase
MGFIPDIEEICTKLPKQRQTLLFSATMPPVIKKLADKFLTDPKRVEVARPATANTNIRQWVVPTTTAKKRDVLRDLLRQEEVTTAIIFSNRKTTVRDLNKALQKSGFRSTEIHGDMDQPSRLAELDRFKAGTVNILVASDVAARGLDIKGVSHVFNFDAPWHPDDYVHRIGRTGRAGATGTAYTLVTPEDAENIREIEKLTGMKIERYTGDVDAPRNDVAISEAEANAPAAKRGRGGRPVAPKREAAPKAEPKAKVERKPAAEAPKPAPKPEEAPKRQEAPRSEQPRREEPRRQAADDGPDDGWNGPVPDFLNFTLD